MLPVLLQGLSGVRTVPDFLINLEQYGLLDAMLPFILIFAVVFTAMKTTKALGANKGVHTLIALVLALLVVVPHVLGTYPPGADVVNIINSALPNVSLLIVIIVTALIMFGIFMPGKDIPGGGFFGFVAAGIIIYIFGLSAGWWETVGMLSFLANPDIQAVLLIILVFGLVIMFITSDSPVDNLRKFRDLITGRNP